MKDKSVDKNVDVRRFLEELRELALVVGEDCPEGHRKDPGSGRCLPMGSTDHTAFTRSVNNDDGPQWRGEVDKTNTTFAAEKETALDADEMDEPQSCANGTTFSFVQRKCVSLEEAEREDSGAYAFVEEEEADHSEVVSKDPEGRRDPVGFKCPPKMIFDYKRRECIPLNKDTVMASINSLVERIEEKNNTKQEVSVVGTEAGRERLAKALGHLVADHFAMAIKGYNFHWNVVSPIFEDLHAMFGADYDTLLEQADGIAERVRALGFSSPASLNIFSQLTSISDQSEAPDWRSMVEEWVGDLEHLSREARAVQQVADEIGDNNTLAMLDNLVLCFDKRAWMYKSILKSGSDPFAGMSDQRVELEDRYAKHVKAAELKTKQRKALPDSAFGVPGKRKFPLHDCSHVRNAMARFNQAKGLTPGEKATLRRKILAKAKACGIKVESFGKASTAEEFAAVMQELTSMEAKKDTARLEAYRAAAQKQGPCPPGMMWEKMHKRCMHMRGFVEELANHSDIVAKDPEGRRDPVGFQCPSGEFFDFTNRRCLPLDPSRKPGTTTTKASDEDAAKRDLSPLPEGRPARLPQDCPAGTIWDGDLRTCKPLDSRKKTKSSDEEEAAIPPQFLKNIKKKGKNGDEKDEKNGKKNGFPFKKKSKSEDESAQAPASGPGKEKDDHGCAPDEAWNPVLKKCMRRKGAFKGKSASESAGREGLTTEVPGKVKLPQDCPPGTIWDGTRRTCTPLDSRDKNRPGGSSGPMNPKDVASMSVAQLIQALDEILMEKDHKEKSKVAARDLPNAAFPPSLVSPTHRSLMHHNPGVEDPYDTATVDVARLRNALFRASSVRGFSAKAVEDAVEHLVFHAREIVAERLAKKA